MYINDPLTATKANTHTRIQTGLYSTQARQSAPRSRRLDPTPRISDGIPGAPVPLPVFGAGAYRSPLQEPRGCGCFQHAWVIAEPRLWQLGDPPVHMRDM